MKHSMYRSTLIVVVAVIAVGSGWLESAQAETLPKKWVRLRERLAGAWQYHGTAGEDTLYGIWITLPTAGGHCLRDHEWGWAENGDEKRVYVGDGLGYFDPATNQLRGDICYANGSSFRSVSEIVCEGDEVVAVKGERKSVDPDGNVRTGEVKFEFKRADKFLYSVTFNEKPIELTFHRLASFATPDRVPTAEICREFFTKYFVGTWQWSPVGDNKEEPFTWTCDLSKDVSSHYCRSVRGEKVFHEAFYTFAPETKCWTGVSIGGDGTRGIYRFGSASPFRGAGKWLYSVMEEVSIDGTKELGVARLSVPHNGVFTVQMSDPATPGEWRKIWRACRISDKP